MCKDKEEYKVVFKPKDAMAFDGTKLNPNSVDDLYYVGCDPYEPEPTILDEQVALELDELKEYHNQTTTDKYNSADVGLYPRDLFMSDKHGKSINIFNAVKYLSRYLSDGYEKSDNREDVKKAIHYLLFELVRTK